MPKISIPQNLVKIRISSAKFCIFERKFSDKKKISDKLKFRGIAVLPCHDVTESDNGDGNDGGFSSCSQTRECRIACDDLAVACCVI